VCLLHCFARTYFLAVGNRPLLRGFLVTDPDLLGKLTTSPDTARDDRHRVMALSYFELLAEHGLLREDMHVDEIGFAYQATFEGFLRTAGPASAGGLDPRADLLARTIQRAFESETVAPDSVLRDVAAATDTLLSDLIDADRAESGVREA
jgi:hypothetical protein